MKFLLGAWLAACGTDAVVTHAALRTDRVVELHLSQNPWVTDALVAGQAGAWLLAERRLRKGHPKLAMGVTLGLVAVRGWAVAQNVHTLEVLK